MNLLSEQFNFWWSLDIILSVYSNVEEYQRLSRTEGLCRALSTTATLKPQVLFVNLFCAVESAGGIEILALNESSTLASI